VHLDIRIVQRGQFSSHAAVERWASRFCRRAVFLEVTIPLLLLQLFEKYAFFLRHPVQITNKMHFTVYNIQVCPVSRVVHSMTYRGSVKPWIVPKAKCNVIFVYINTVKFN
jgi:hypothetical protein